MSCVCGRQYRTVTPRFCIVVPALWLHKSLSEMLARNCGCTKVCQKRWRGIVAAQKSVRNAGKQLWLHKSLSETLASNCGCTKSRQKLRQVIVAAQRLLYPKGESNPLWNNGVCGVGGLILIVRSAARDYVLRVLVHIIQNGTLVEDDRIERLC